MDLFFQAEDGIRDDLVTGVQTCALPISPTDLNRLAGRANRNLAAILCLTLRIRPLLPQRCCLLFVVVPVCVTVRGLCALAHCSGRHNPPRAEPAAAPARGQKAQLRPPRRRRPRGSVRPTRFPPTLVGCSERSPPPARLPASAAESLPVSRYLPAKRCAGSSRATPG